jgi:YD repeat-containing protein
MTRITDAKGITFLQNFYGPSGRVLRQIQADGSEYRFRYQLSGGTSSGAGCTVTNPPTGGGVIGITLPFGAEK